MPSASARLNLVQRLSIRRCVGGRQLACGCTLGIYETYGGATINVIDVRSPACPHAEHTSNRLLPTGPGEGEGRRDRRS